MHCWLEKPCNPGTKNDEDGQLRAKETIYNKKSKKVKSFNKKKKRFGR